MTAIVPNVHQLKRCQFLKPLAIALYICLNVLKPFKDTAAVCLRFTDL